MEIRPARPDDEPAWRELWRGYCEFYETEIAAEVTAETWRRLLDPGSPMAALVAAVDGRVIGFANYVVHPSTWAEPESCYLEDLYVEATARSRGAGRALIDALLELAGERRWENVYWHTREDNERARALYDSFGAADGFVRYVISPPRVRG